MEIKELSIDQLSLLMSMQIFMCDVDTLNYQDLYDQMLTLDNDTFVAADYAVWEPFENFPYDKLMSEINSHQTWISDTLEAYETTNSK